MRGAYKKVLKHSSFQQVYLYFKYKFIASTHYFKKL